MARLSKADWALHDEAEALLSLGRPLTDGEVEKVLRQWNPSARHNVGAAGAFFTPMELARDLAHFVRLHDGGRYIDLCAGIGRLTWPLHLAHQWDSPREKARTSYTCVEINPHMVEVGRRLMPWAEWICGSAFDEQLITSLDPFDVGVSNPPFGRVRTREAVGSDRWLRYRGQADLQACEVLARCTRHGAFVLLPQSSLPWDRRGKRQDSSEYCKWRAANTEWELLRTSLDPRCYEFEQTGVLYDIAELDRAEGGRCVYGPLFEEVSTFA